jgi:hypothetical protein
MTAEVVWFLAWRNDPFSEVLSESAQEYTLFPDQLKMS